MNPLLKKNYAAGGSIADKRFVKFSADDTVTQASAATDLIIGVCRQPGGVSSGERCDVTLLGVAYVTAGDTISRGTLVTADADGKAVPVVRHTHSENSAVSYTQTATTGAAAVSRSAGMALLAAAAGDEIPVLLSPSYN